MTKSAVMMNPATRVAIKASPIAAAFSRSSTLRRERRASGSKDFANRVEVVKALTPSDGMTHPHGSHNEASTSRRLTLEGRPEDSPHLANV